MSADRDLVVRLTPDPSALLEFLDTAAGALTTAADTLRAAYPVAEDAREPWDVNATAFRVGDRVRSVVDVTGDGAGQLGTVTAIVHESPAGYEVAFDDDTTPGSWELPGSDLEPAPVLDQQPTAVGPASRADSVDEIWYPVPGDRVTIHCQHPSPVVPDGTEAIVLEVGATVAEQTPVWVVCDGVQGLRVPLHELRPPTTSGPVPLVDSLDLQMRTSVDTARACNHIRERLAQYPADTPAAQVYADWFGGAQ